jgi:hypothetical protein
VAYFKLLSQCSSGETDGTQDSIVRIAKRYHSNKRPRGYRAIELKSRKVIYATTVTCFVRGLNLNSKIISPD